MKGLEDMPLNNFEKSDTDRRIDWLHLKDDDEVQVNLRKVVHEIPDNSLKHMPCRELEMEIKDRIFQSGFPVGEIKIKVKDYLEGTREIKEDFISPVTDEPIISSEVINRSDSGPN